jgi:hypothetical protein
VTASARLRIEARAIAEQLGVGTAPQASVDRVAERLDRIRSEAVRPFRELFSGGPDTSCRTAYRPSAAAPECSAASIECAEVPLDDLRAAFVEAGDDPS